MGFTCLKAKATSRGQFTFYHFSPPLYEIYFMSTACLLVRCIAAGSTTDAKVTSKQFSFSHLKNLSRKSNTQSQIKQYVATNILG